jgi:MarR family transcriptional regulator, organic hydroperoxide resistance regulator
MQPKAKTTPASPETEKPAALRESFFVLSRAFYSYVFMLEHLLEEFGLSKIIRPGMGHVLFALWQHDYVTMSNLAGRTGLAASTLTRLTGEMEKVKLVTRKKCAEDGRAVRIELTPLGRSLESMASQVVARLREVVEAGMPKSSVKAVKDGLTAMIDNMETYKQTRIVERSASPTRKGKRPEKRAK